MRVKMQISAFTGLRGLAAWWVVAFHFRDQLSGVAPAAVTAILDRGFLAVDLFFVLSGFVIQLNYGSWFEARVSRPRLRDFAIARLARIYPLHFFLSILFLLNPLAIALFSTAKSLGERWDPLAWALSLVLVQNWGFVHTLSWNVPSWSISTEAFAYVVFPLASCALPRLVRSRGTAAILAALLLAATAALFADTASIGDAVTSRGLPRCVLEFSLGMLLCRVVALDGPPGRGAAGGMLALAATLVAAHFFAGVPDWLTMPAASALIVLAYAGPTAPGAALLSAALPQWLGMVSYSTYLAHYFVKDWVGFLMLRPGIPSPAAFAVYMAGTLAASALLYHAVELPGRRGLRGLCTPSPKPALEGERP